MEKYLYCPSCEKWPWEIRLIQIAEWDPHHSEYVEKEEDPIRSCGECSHELEDREQPEQD